MIYLFMLRIVCFYLRIVYWYIFASFLIVFLGLRMLSGLAAFHLRLFKRSLNSFSVKIVDLFFIFGFRWNAERYFNLLNKYFSLCSDLCLGSLRFCCFRITLLRNRVLLIGRIVLWREGGMSVSCPYCSRAVSSLPWNLPDDSWGSHDLTHHHHCSWPSVWYFPGCSNGLALLYARWIFTWFELRSVSWELDLLWL